MDFFKIGKKNWTKHANVKYYILFHVYFYHSYLYFPLPSCSLLRYLTRDWFSEATRRNFFGGSLLSSSSLGIALHLFSVPFSLKTTSASLSIMWPERILDPSSLMNSILQRRRWGRVCGKLKVCSLFELCMDRGIIELNPCHILWRVLEVRSRNDLGSWSNRGGVCVKHGAKVKQCSHDGCTKRAQNGGVCITHGAKVKLCSSEGCKKQAKKEGVCITHGAKVTPKRCSKEGCTNLAVRGGVCKRHGANRL